ncbi:MAG TPA: Ig-like domain-containing protein [Edaphobacter sp.]|nr:Ig-like domain-containing protein [Edaphobacter sp.]
MPKFVWMIAGLILLPAATAGAQTKVPSTVSLEVTTPLTVFYGEPINGLAQVTASDGSAVTGTVTFYDGTKSFCVLTLANNASCPAEPEQDFGAGTHVFTAMYSGDATHASATSNAVSVTVKQDTTETVLASSANPVAAGGGVVYTATVAGAHAPVAGTVTFYDAAAAMGSATVNGSGTAALSVLMLATGDHAITARYAGNGNSAGSVSAALHETVQGTLAATTTTLTASANPATAGESVVFTAKVAAAGGKAAPTGTVTFVEGGAVLGSAAVKAGSAAWSSSTLSAGSHSIVAQYAGDAMTAGSVSAALNEVVNAQASQGGSDGLTLGVSQVTVAAGDWVTVPVKMTTSASGMAKAVSLSCSGLPEETECSSVTGAAGAQDASGGTATLRISTSAPRDCASSTPYGVPAKSGLLPLGLLLVVAGRRRAWKGLLGVMLAAGMISTMMGCGTGTCTDLGTRPGTYTITVTGSMGGAQASQKVKLVVTP